MGDYLVVFTPVLTIFIYVLIGFALRKLKILDEKSSTTLSKVVLYVSSPCFTVASYYKNFTVENLSTSIEYSLKGIILIAILYLGAIFISKLFTKDGYEQNILKYVFTVPNYGYVAYPIILAFFGEKMMFDFMMFCIFVTVFTSVEGYRLLTDQKRLEFKRLLVPFVIAIPIGMILGLSGLVLPTFAVDILETLGNTMSPLAMILSGVVIGGFNLKEIFKGGKFYLITAYKMLILPLIVLGICLLLNQSSTVTILAVMFASMPGGMNTIVYPKSIGKTCEVGAKTVTLSTIISLVTLPLFLWILQTFFI